MEGGEKGRRVGEGLERQVRGSWLHHMDIPLLNGMVVHLSKVVPVMVLLGEQGLMGSRVTGCVIKGDCGAPTPSLLSLTCGVSGFTLPSTAAMLSCLAQSNSELILQGEPPTLSQKRTHFSSLLVDYLRYFTTVTES